MARIPLIEADDPNAEPAARELLAKIKTTRGVSWEPNVYKAMANHPEAMKGFLQFAKAAYFDNSMTPAQRELAYLTASVTNDCHY